MQIQLWHVSFLSNTLHTWHPYGWTSSHHLRSDFPTQIYVIAPPIVIKQINGLSMYLIPLVQYSNPIRGSVVNIQANWCTPHFQCISKWHAEIVQSTNEAKNLLERHFTNHCLLKKSASTQLTMGQDIVVALVYMQTNFLFTCFPDLIICFSPSPVQICRFKRFWYLNKLSIFAVRVSKVH